MTVLTHVKIKTPPNKLNRLMRKLSNFLPLSPRDHRFLDKLWSDERSLNANADLMVEGTIPRGIFLLKEGMAIRYRMMPDGSRQIMTFLIPGDLCDMHVFLLQAVDHSIRTVAASRFALIPRSSITHLLAHYPRLAAAMWWSSQQEESMLRERIVSLGRRDARGRIAYLLCELMWRHKAVGLTSDSQFQLPLTQIELADTLGLTPVHVNRILQEFRRRNLITMERQRLHLLDVDELQAIAGFDCSYLHLDGASPETRRYFDDLEQEESPAGAGSESQPRAASQ